MSQIVTSKLDSSGARGGRRKAPRAFTEAGVAMLSGVLHSPRAIHANISIMRTFAHLRRLMSADQEIREKIADIEHHLAEHDEQLDTLFETIQNLLEPSNNKAYRSIGFKRDQ